MSLVWYIPACHRSEMAYVGALSPGAYINLSQPYFAGNVSKVVCKRGRAVCDWVRVTQ